MKKLLIAVLGAASLLIAPAAYPCGENGPQMVNLDQGAKIAKEKSATFVDANSPDTRAKFGVIPGAVLLTSSSSFDPAKELPAAKDQKLIFYCANTRCGASHDAAKRAIEAGYSDVFVLPEGIMGWTKAGHRVDKKVVAARNS